MTDDFQRFQQLIYVTSSHPWHQWPAPDAWAEKATHTSVIVAVPGFRPPLGCFFNNNFFQFPSKHAGGSYHPVFLNATFLVNMFAGFWTKKRYGPSLVLFCFEVIFLSQNKRFVWLTNCDGDPLSFGSCCTPSIIQNLEVISSGYLLQFAMENHHAIDR